MTKEQYLLFKSDLKLSIDIIKLFPNRFWKTVHHGFASEEEKQAAISEANKKMYELNAKIKVRRKGYNQETTYPVISASSFTTHFAYYCAKHQLNDEQAYEYVKTQYAKMREPKAFDALYYWRQVKEILTAYEEVVCDNESVD